MGEFSVNFRRVGSLVWSLILYLVFKWRDYGKLLVKEGGSRGLGVNYLYDGGIREVLVVVLEMMKSWGGIGWWSIWL